MAGGLLGLLRMCQRHPERVNETTVDELAEAELRLLGVPAGETARLAALPLPDTAAAGLPGRGAPPRTGGLAACSLSFLLPGAGDTRY